MSLQYGKNVCSCIPFCVLQYHLSMPSHVAWIEGMCVTRDDE